MQVKWLLETHGWLLNCIKYRVLERLFPTSRQMLYIATQESFSSINAAGPRYFVPPCPPRPDLLALFEDLFSVSAGFVKYFFNSEMGGAAKV